MTRFALLAALCLCGTLSAATLTVTNLNDSGAGSLRQACIDAASGDTVVFQAGLAGVVTFAAGPINLGAKALTITGNADVSGAPAITLNGNQATRLLNTGAALSLDTLALYQGYAIGSEGGVIRCDGGSVTCTGCTFLENYAALSGGAIWCNLGNVSCSGCTFDLNTVALASAKGGAISCTQGNVTCTGCAFNGNTLFFNGDGGAIYQAGFGNTLTCTDCTFSNNIAYADSVSIGNGGAIYCNGASITCTGCTFYANFALRDGGAIWAQTYSVSCTDCTFSTNLGVGRCIYTGSAQVTITNCIVADQYTSGWMFINGGGATFTSGGYNICTASAVDVPWMNATGDQVSTDPLLGPLQDNGGPVPTMRPLTGSPAIDKGGGSATTTDARGYGRPADDAAIANATGGDGRDIGAVECELPEITLMRDGVEIVDGGGDNAYGPAGTAISRVFTIRNDGYATLNIGAITFSNQSNCTVTSSAAPAATLAHAATTTFTLEITPSAAGPFSFDLQIASDDAGKDPYNVHIVGTATRAGGGNNGDDDESGCTTGDQRDVAWLVLTALALLATRRRISRQT